MKNEIKLIKMPKTQAIKAILILSLLGAASASGQQPPPVVPGASLTIPSSSPQTMTKFDLDFRGGGPKELVAAIQKASGKPLNVVLPDDVADVKIPALKMQNVNVGQLFTALEGVTGSLAFGFRPVGGTPGDDTIWSLYIQRPRNVPSKRTCHFYSLAPFLDEGLTVDDITTAIKTGAKMLGEEKEPTISFHKDTKLLIAVGEPEKLQIIDAALKALSAPKTTRASAGSTKPAETKPGENQP